MTGELLKPPHPLELERYRDLYRLEEWHEDMPGYDLTLFFHRLLVERDLLIEAVCQAKGLPSGTYPLPAKEISKEDTELFQKFRDLLQS